MSTDPIYYILEWKTRRQQLLSPISEKSLRNGLQLMADVKGWEIYTITITGPTITVYLRVDRQTSPHAAQYWLKRGTVQPLRRRRDFRNLPSVWTRNYQARSVRGPDHEGDY